MSHSSTTAATLRPLRGPRHFLRLKRLKIRFPNECRVLIFHMFLIQKVTLKRLLSLLDSTGHHLVLGGRSVLIG